jgi:glycosyltransferase involved in cell wall biosynthesis
MVSEVAGTLAAVDVVAFPSLSEGLPVALLEAMAMRRPVVASAVGGIPGVVADGQNGLLVPPGDPDALGGALGRLLGDPALRSVLGGRARETVRQRYSEERMHRRILEVYGSVLGERRPDARARGGAEGGRGPCGS